MKTFLTFVLFIAVAFTAACGNSCAPRPVVHNDWVEYDQPFYPNQQPLYVDGDYYIFYDNAGNYRRVRRSHITYIPSTVYIQPIQPAQREQIYSTMPRKSTVPDSRTGPGVANLTTKPSTVSSSRTSTVPRSSSTRPSTVPSSRSTTSPSSSRPSTVPTSRPSTSSPSRPSTVPSSRKP